MMSWLWIDKSATSYLFHNPSEQLDRVLEIWHPNNFEGKNPGKGLLFPGFTKSDPKSLFLEEQSFWGWTQGLIPGLDSHQRHERCNYYAGFIPRPFNLPRSQSGFLTGSCALSFTLSTFDRSNRELSAARLMRSRLCRSKSVPTKWLWGNIFTTPRP